MFSRLFKFKNNNFEIDLNNIPRHIAIVMDGNGRWAKKRALPRPIGHREGAKTLKKITQACYDLGVKYLSVYAFSTENWKRPQEEVSGLMDLMLDYLKNAEEHIGGKNIRIKIIGDVTPFSQEIKDEIIAVEKRTIGNIGLQLNLAINYGARSEITSALKNIINNISENQMKANIITEEIISNNLYTFGIEDPELLIRPGGEKRISNFLLWQCAYTELVFTDVLWPDFTEIELKTAIHEYQVRNRRFGGV